MARQGYDLQLTRYDARGWSATFYPTGMMKPHEARRFETGGERLAGILEIHRAASIEAMTGESAKQRRPGKRNTS